MFRYTFCLLYSTIEIVNENEIDSIFDLEFSIKLAD